MGAPLTSQVLLNEIQVALNLIRAQCPSAQEEAGRALAAISANSPIIRERFENTLKCISLHDSASLPVHEKENFGRLLNQIRASERGEVPDIEANALEISFGLYRADLARLDAICNYRGWPSRTYALRRLIRDEIERGEIEVPEEDGYIPSADVPRTAPRAQDIRAIMDEFGMNVREFAALIPVEERTVQRWMDETRTPQPSMWRVFEDIRRTMEEVREREKLRGDITI